MPWVDEKICLHPLPTFLLKLNESDENIYRCSACGEINAYVDVPNEDRR